MAGQVGEGQLHAHRPQQLLQLQATSAWDTQLCQHFGSHYYCLTLMDLSGCANCFPSLPAQKDLAVLYLQLGYLNDNLFISCAFYMVRDRSCWQRRNTARGMQAPWQQLPAYIPLYFLFFLSRAQIPANCPSTLDTSWKWKEKQRNCCTHSACVLLSPQHQPQGSWRCWAHLRRHCNGNRGSKWNVFA